MIWKLTCCQLMLLVVSRNSHETWARVYLFTQEKFLIDTGDPLGNIPSLKYVNIYCLKTNEYSFRGRLMKRDQQIKLLVTGAAVILKESKTRWFVFATRRRAMEQMFHAGRK